MKQIDSHNSRGTILFKYKLQLKTVFVCFYLLLFSTQLRASDTDYVFKKIAEEDELAHAWISALHQDFLGFIWIGTADGLYRYDGVNLKAFRSIMGDSTTLTGNGITVIFEDSQQQLWVGTSRGINQYHRGSDQFYSETSWPKVNISAITESSSGDIFVGSYEGMHILSSQSGTFNSFFQYDNTSTLYDGNQPLCWFSDTKLLTNGPHGLDIFDTQTQTFSHKYNLPNSPEWQSVTALVSDFKGNIWINLREFGLYYIDISEPSGIKRLKLPADHFLQNGTILSAMVSKDSILWLGTENNGLALIDLPEFYTNNKLDIIHITDDQAQHNLVNNSIYALYEDEQENVWIGTYGGLNLYNEVYSNFKHIRESIDGKSIGNNNVTSFFEYKSRIWIGTEGGISIHNPQTNTYSAFSNLLKRGQQLSSDAIYSMLSTSDDQVWIGTWSGGLNLYNPQTNSLNYYMADDETSEGLSSNNIFSIVEDENGYLWIGTMGGGLNKFDPSTNKFTAYVHENFEPGDIRNNWVRQVFLDSRNRLWISTYSTLALMNREKETFHHFFNNENDRSSISDAGTIVIFEDSRQNMWFGTQTGLNLYHEDDSSFSVITVEDGLPSNVINAIVEDNQGDLWISTNNGIARFQNGIMLPSEPHFTNFDLKDGLQSNKFNQRSALKSSEGKLYFGGKNGYNSFHPSEIKENKSIPPVIITELLLFNKQEVMPGTPGIKLDNHITQAEKIQLKYKHRFFTINFVALNYIVPEKNQYQYILEGLEENWNQAGNRNNATYTNLDPGEYTFRVKASNNSGIWNEKGAQLKIQILPPWYRTLWAYLAYIIILFAIILVYRRFILIRSQLQHELVLQRVEKEKLDHVNQVKTRFFTNISHEFRTPLTLILGPLESLLSDINLKPKVSQKLAIIQKNARRLLRLINQLLDISQIEADHLKLKVRQGEIVTYTREIASLFRWLATQRNINYSIIAQNSRFDCFFDGDKIEKILYNLIANAFKYTPDGGTIEVIIKGEESRSQKQLQLIVRDSGIGIEQKDHEKIFDHFYRSEEKEPKSRVGSGIGLALVNGLVSTYGGKIDVSSQPGSGTEFTVNLPAHKAAFKEEQIDEHSMHDSPPSLDIYDMEQETPSDSETNIPAEVTSNDKRSLLLIVEDNPEIQEHLVELFNSDYKILQAENGLLALAICNEQIPDLVISDIKMPEMDGIQLCSKLKNEQNTSHIPVVLLTAKAASEDRLEGVNTGADAYFTKPFDGKLLQATVKNLISSRQKLKESFSRSVQLEPSEIAITSLDEKFLRKAIAIVDKNIANPDYSVDSFSKEIGMSRSHLHRKFVGLTGYSPSGFIRNLRMKRAAVLLTKGQLTVSEILYEVGIKSRSYFTKSFKDQFGCSPTDYVAKYKDENPGDINLDF